MKISDVKSLQKNKAECVSLKTVRKRWVISGILLLIAMFNLISLNKINAQDNPLRISGKLITDQRFRTQNPVSWSWNENRMEINLHKKFEDKALFYSNLWIRNLGFSRLNSLSQLTDKNLVNPIEADLQEMYVEINQFIWKDLQLKAGRQKFNWGSGDKLNPVNVLNAPDLEDIWDFGRMQGSDALKLTYFLNDYKFEGIWLPLFRPSTLPEGDWIDALMPVPELPQGIKLNSLANNIQTPELSLKHSSSYGFRTSGNIAGFDISGNYAYFYDGVPSPDSNVITFAGGFDKIDITAVQQYIRLHQAGVTFSGELLNIGVWGEFASFFPTEALIMKTRFGTLVMDSLIFENKPWFKYLLGADYTFKDGSYLNIQYLHGFYHEKGNKNLNDYFTFSWEKSLLHDKLKIRPLAGCIVVPDWSDISENYAVIYTPEFSYFPNDNAEISLGYRMIEGKGRSTFARVNNKDEVYMKISYSF